MSEGQTAGPRHPDEDALAELCLGHADPRSQEKVAAHLEGCASCRTRYDELAAAAEAVLPAAPWVAPPAGFETRVLAALDGQPRRAFEPAGGDEAARSVGRGRPTRQPVRRRTVLLAAAAGLLGLASGAGVTAYLGRTPEPVEDPWAAPLLTSDGVQVGAVRQGYDDRGPVLVVTVPGGRPGLAVTCLLELADGRVENRGRWTLSAERANSWVVPLGEEEVARVDLVTGTGSVWASAIPHARNP